MKLLPSILRYLVLCSFALRANANIPLHGHGPAPSPQEHWDYVIVGGGPAGLVVADRLSETGKRVLLVEAGTTSTYASGGRARPEWLENTKLSRFDVPGFFSAFTTHPDNYPCTDINVTAACVLGGGAAVNSGIFIMPQDEDWESFPEGWKPMDMKSAYAKTHSKIPSTDTPSLDGKVYLPESYDILGSMARSLGWDAVKANFEPNEKNRTYSRTPFMFMNATRGGPLTAYLLPALSRKSFSLRLHTKALRVVREGNRVTGIEVAANPYNNGTLGKREIIRVAPGKGKVILTAGAFGTPKILFQSGIGPKQILEVVKKYSDIELIEEKDWIELPVGEGLMDHPATYVVFRHESTVGYDFNTAYDNPVENDKELYLKKGSGPLAASNARISMWEEFKGQDGIVRAVQWNGRAGGAFGLTDPKLLLFTAYLSHGLTSRGNITLIPTSSGLITTVDIPPYLTTSEDTNAVISALKSLLPGYYNVPGLELVVPDLNTTTVETFIREYPPNVGRGSNHWMGTCRMGDDDGRKRGGKAVVDNKGKVWGVKGLYILDASIFPGMVTSNPVGAIVVAAERGVERILGY